MTAADAERQIAAAVKERPILFSGAMVRAILEGRKTQTRRVIKPHPVNLGNGCWEYDSEVYVSDEAMHDHLFHEVYGTKGTPYGSLWGDGRGDRLWVRETWQHAPEDSVWYRATDEDIVGGCYKRLWKPSIHMPRGVSRLTLEIVDVRVERLRDITEEDAKAEGVTLGEDRSYSYAANGLKYEPAKEAFMALWESINGKRPGCSWAENPWVWVIEFKKESP